MEYIKYHLLNIIVMFLFSYISAITINQIIKNNLAVYPAEKNIRKTTGRIMEAVEKTDISQILESGFFRTAPVLSDASDAIDGDKSSLNDLKLLGTITGPEAIARAMIQKKGERQPGIFKVWQHAYGFNIVSIESSKIYLKKNKETLSLNLYEKKDASPSNATGSASSNVVKKTISRSEMQQNVMNNVDSLMEGINAGPYRINGLIEGYKIIRIRPQNILFTYGIRSGDIIKRINGKKIESTEKLFNIWQGVKNESKMLFDIERDGQIITFDINISD